ncbi:GIY-YIG nuclease family protein [Muricauda sp. SCSIO 64092]|uniref:GIY-YIG nuclease family protein n=1 Tax=Allomuricauda sp. SCSIO 64092 TaxID=2908842 RepID=UPI001FF11F92|nr:GIY-YIG nuclease family protein [Muricauda sp. SCSIO 64092]UOY05996.1 GIY-YIG nuclease family protein [Muricauda sp. SCSIO 64092]
MGFHVYILYSPKFDKYYVGQTMALTNRLDRHNSGLFKSTAPYRLWKVVWTTEKDSRGEAMILERKLKNLSKARLQKFIEKYSGSPDDGSTISGC